jgi:hypothetical protein
MFFASVRSCYRSHATTQFYNVSHDGASFRALPRSFLHASEEQRAAAQANGGDASPSVNLDPGRIGSFHADLGQRDGFLAW